MTQPPDQVNVQVEFPLTINSEIQYGNNQVGITVTEVAPAIKTKMQLVDEAYVFTTGFQGIPGPQGPTGATGPAGSGGNYIEKSGDYYAAFSDYWVSMDASNGNAYLTLPITVAGDTGIRQLTVSKKDSTDYSVFVVTQEGQLIDGISTSFELDSWNEVVSFLSTGNGFKVF